MKSLRLYGLLISVMLLLVLPGLAHAQSKTLYWDRFDFDITVLQNGDVRIVETQEIVFTGGTFTFGSRGIEHDRFSSLKDVQVSEGGRGYDLDNSGAPYTFQVYQDGSEIKIKWFFPTTGDSTHTYTLAYTITGGLRYYEAGDQLWWKTVVANRSFAVNHTRVVVHLPEATAIQNYDIYGAMGNANEIDEHTLEFTNQERIPPGEEFEVRVEFTPDVVAGAPASWQAGVDEEQAVLEQRASVAPIINLLTLVFSLVALVGGFVGLYLLWYNRGRDRPVGLVADYLAEPPSDLRPGSAGTLLDEQADMQDVIATLVDLARRDVVSIEEVEESGFLGIGSKRDFVYRREEHDEPLSKYEQTLLSKIFKGNSKESRLSDLKEKFYTALPTLKKQLYQEVVDKGFFRRSPERTRSIYAGLGIGGLILTVVVGIISTAALSTYTALAICPSLGLGAVFLGLVLLSRYMPRKTPEGAEAAARWNAFKRYLENIEKYTDLQEAKDIFDKYLPYAIAFGLEKSYVRKFSQVRTPAPTWYYPVGVPYGTYRRRPGYPASGEGGGRGPGQAAPAGLPGGREGAGTPSLDTMADGMFSGLDSMSQGFFSMLDSAGNTFGSRPRSSSGSKGGFRGGGWSGGGGFGGGGGGGGSAGFG